MRVFFLFHNDWYQYLKADLLASQYHIDGFVVIQRKRDIWTRYLWKRAKRIGFGKVLDELVLRLYWMLFQRWFDDRELNKLMNSVQAKLPQHPPVDKIICNAWMCVVRTASSDHFYARLFAPLNTA